MSREAQQPIVVSAVAERSIRRHGQEAYPFECCGALIGRDGVVVDALPLPNTTDEGPRRRFRVSAQDYRTAERAASSKGCELVGFYHSHPDHPARPSQFDLQHAWPVFSYLILSVEDGDPRELTAWRLREDRSTFEEQLLAVGQDGPLPARSGT